MYAIESILDIYSRFGMLGSQESPDVQNCTILDFYFTLQEQNLVEICYCRAIFLLVC